nr:protein ALP1-like [Tanacetum cinerariifolium]
MQKVDRLSEELVKACVEYGCFRVVNHGVPMELMVEMKEVAAQLFSLPEEIKRQTSTNSPEHGKGYIGRNPITPFLEGFSIDEIWSPNEFCDSLGASPHQRTGIFALVKCTFAIRQMTYDTAPVTLDEYMQMGAKTTRDNLVQSCNAVMELYGRSIDYIDWPWENLPHAFKAQFCRGDYGSDPFILLEAIASQDLWIWHAFFGVSRMNNDVNVLQQSPIFNNLKTRKAPDVLFVANNVAYERGYYLTIMIYPEWTRSDEANEKLKKLDADEVYTQSQLDVKNVRSLMNLKLAKPYEDFRILYVALLLDQYSI